MTWLITLFKKRSPDRLPNRCVHSVLHSENTSHLFGDCRGPDAKKRSTERVYSYVRVPTQVLQSLIKSYICFSICKALQSLILGYFRPKGSYKVLYFIQKEISEMINKTPT